MLKRLALLGTRSLLPLRRGRSWAYIRTTSPYRGFSSSEVFVEVPQGASVATIATRLADAGVVADALTFRLVARSPVRSGICRRVNTVSRSGDPGARSLDRLARGDVFTKPMTVPEGLSIFEVAALVERAGLAQADEFRRAASDGSRIARFDPEARTLEGYPVSRYLCAAAVGGRGRPGRGDGRPFRAGLRRRTPRARRVAAVVDARPDDAGLDGGEGDRRGTTSAPVVAAVYRNRLRIGMPLQCDPTVIYAKMLDGTWRGNLTPRRPADGLAVQHVPLPRPAARPHRLARPRLDRRDAAPADVPYLYFVSRNDGSHVFAATLDEHNRNVNRYQRSRTRH